MCLQQLGVAGGIHDMLSGGVIGKGSNVVPDMIQVLGDGAQVHDAILKLLIVGISPLGSPNAHKKGMLQKMPFYSSQLFAQILLLQKVHFPFFSFGFHVQASTLRQ
eukprot:4102216-Ditylum_brightwellii.AAC.1